MSKSERIFLVAAMLFMAVASISILGKELYAILAMFEVMIGVVIGMAIFFPNRDNGDIT